MSLAVNLTMKLAEVAAGPWPIKDADVEILERHHRFKEDSPSGTALKFGEIIAAAMGQTRIVTAAQGRPGKRPHERNRLSCRPRGRQSRRAHHHFRHVGRDDRADGPRHQPRLLRPGALAAAKFLAGKPPGLYGMSDVLGL